MEEKKTGRMFWVIALAALTALLLSERVRGAAGAVIFPFAAAYAAARFIRPAGVFLSRLCRVREKTGCTVWGILVCLAAVCGLSSLSGRLWEQLCSIAELLPERAAGAVSEAAERVGALTQTLRTHFSMIGDISGSGQMEEIVTGAIRAAAGELGSTAAGVFSSMVTGFPGGIMSLLIAVIAFLYLTADMDGVGKSVRAVIGCFASGDRVERIARSFGRFSDAVFAYLRAYAFLTTVTFAELAAGFSLIGADNPLALAFLTAAVDALPLFGCGIVLVPWALWCLLTGEMRRAVSLFILQGVVYAVRQFLEPRVIGRMTGVHPFVALAVLFAGLKLGGVGGMILAPVLLMSVMRMRED
ncbi:MAG: AI-2E family transporter [Clostridia bacterium]|nr:AI-2E family transporter [Clostridia bacterium]